MSPTSWLRNVRPGRRLTPANRELAVERLEDRTVPAFLSPVDYGVGSYLYGVTASDFNSDSVVDLALINYGIDEYGNNAVSVLLGNENGTFQPAQHLAADPTLIGFAVGDFNADRNLDLATAKQGAVGLLLGNGDGSFAPPASIETVSGSESMAVGDFNADGQMDLVVTSTLYDDYAGNFVGYANVLLGHGNGTFSAPIINSLGVGFHTSAAVADVNSDGNLDLASVNWSIGTVSVVLGDGTGSLQGLADFNAEAEFVVVGDVNGDAKIDLIATTFDGSVNVLLGDGLGAFGTAQNFAAGGCPVLGDFNGDGRADIVTSNYGDGTVSVLLGAGDGTFESRVVAATGYFPTGVAAGDFNGDGWLDAATANGTGTLTVLINDHSWPSVFAPSVAVNDVRVAEGNTGTVNATFTLTLSTASDEPITVHYQTVDESATTASDFVGSSGDVTFAPGATSLTITVPVFGDRLAEPTESFAVIISTSAAFIGDAFGVGTILDDEPSITINDVTVTEGNTGAVNATFTLTLSTASDEPITVHYQTVDESATAGSDFASSSGDVIFAAGETSQAITIPVFGDRQAEATESFVVNISTIAAFVGEGVGVCSIIDDEPRISINDVTVTEGNSGTVNATFTVSLSVAYDEAVTVQYASADQTARAGSDYQAASGTLTFAAGELTRTITVLVNGDTLGEPNETFLVNLSCLTTRVTDGQGKGTILGDDLAFVWVNPWDVSLQADSGDKGRASATFTGTGAAGDLGAASATAGALAQSSEAWGGDRWVPSSYFSARVSFQRTFQLIGSPTGWEVTLDALLSGWLFARSEYTPNIAGSGVSALVRIIQDATGAATHYLDFGQGGCTAYEGSQTFNITIPGSREGVLPDGTYTVIGVLDTFAAAYFVEFAGNQAYSDFSHGLSTTVNAVVWDNQPDITISDAAFAEGNNGAATRYFTVALSKPSTKTVTVDFALADASATLASNDYGYLNANRTLTFAPGVTQQTIAVRIYGDRNPEPNETFTVNLSNPTNGRIKDGQAIGTIQNDEPRITIGDVSKKEGKNNQTTQFTFTVTLSEAYDQAVTMSFRTVDATATPSDTDYIAKTGTLTFAPGQTTKTITIEVKGDSRVEANETFYVDLFGNSGNSLFTKNRGIGTILNDD